MQAQETVGAVKGTRARVTSAADFPHRSTIRPATIYARFTYKTSTDHLLSIRVAIKFSIRAYFDQRNRETFSKTTAAAFVITILEILRHKVAFFVQKWVYVCAAVIADAVRVFVATITNATKLLTNTTAAVNAGLNAVTNAVSTG
jgi:hypothetical protein